MKKGVPFAIAIGVIIAIGVAVSVISQDLEKQGLPPNPEEPEWVRSGPFAISKSSYKTGEKIPLSIQGLTEKDVGEVLWITPDGIVANVSPFDGSQKSGYSTYYEPDTTAFQGIYEVKQLQGKWTLKFNNTSYLPIQFGVTEEFVRGAEAEIKDIPRPTTKPIGPSDNSTD